MIRPMEPVLIQEVKPSPDYVYQVKWDGVRLITEIENNQVQMYTKKGHDRTNTYVEIKQEIVNKFAKQTKIVLDGEIIAWKEGKPDFFQVMKRDRLKEAWRIQTAIHTNPVYYIVFDLLCWQGKWITDQPLWKRQKILEREFHHGEYIQVCPTYDESEELIQLTRANNWEGIVCKEREGLYHLEEKHPSWLKYKNWKYITGTVIGVSIKSDLAYSILIVIKKENEYRYIGKVSSGLSVEEKQLITNWAREIAIPKSILAKPPQIQEEVIWTPPVLQVEIEFLEWTPDGTMRSAKCLGFK
ncbi:bifunctional non-homologous end joining protein LigD [Croceifilum oryzae]|uniref:DNA ligase (ATP) n=1 Tax=Croceifilum oryzae TaxID=1553429 RepID=A0AAJ1THA9_9BACL|nr:RNA ligase family protein [Croceifilum oryzae]MDQ0416977.1 bifunctional non-homologous end joining protein LigD [Croceifilum oryzae]